MKRHKEISTKLDLITELRAEFKHLTDPLNGLVPRREVELLNNAGGSPTHRARRGEAMITAEQQRFSYSLIQRHACQGISIRP
jgi:hypothetical protein